MRFYATFASETPSPSRWSRARSAVTNRGISPHPFRRRKPLTASRTPAATHRSIICPPRHRFTLRFTWRVRLSRLSAALVVASDRCRRVERCSVRTVSVSSSPSLGLTRFRGHLTLVVEGVHDAKNQKTAFRRSFANSWSRWSEPGRTPEDLAGEFEPTAQSIGWPPRVLMRRPDGRTGL